MGKVTEFNLIENRKEGWNFIGKINGLYKKLKKFHYFINGRSLCGKYENDKNNFLPASMLYDYECCKICLMKLKERRQKWLFTWMVGILI